MNPEHGARIALHLASAKGALRYAVDLYAPNATWRSVAEIDLSSGAVSIADWEPPTPNVPAWLVQATRGLLRAIWRSKPERGWPQRITRWRPGPEASASS